MDIPQLVVSTLALTRAMVEDGARQKPRKSSKGRSPEAALSDLQEKFKATILGLAEHLKETPEQKLTRLERQVAELKMKEMLEAQERMQQLERWRNTQGGRCPHPPKETLFGGEVAVELFYYMQKTIPAHDNHKTYPSEPYGRWRETAPTIHTMDDGRTAFTFYKYYSRTYMYTSGNSYVGSIPYSNPVTDLDFRMFNDIAAYVSQCFGIQCTFVSSTNGQRAEQEDQLSTASTLVIGCDLSSVGQ